MKMNGKLMGFLVGIVLGVRAMGQTAAPYMEAPQATGFPTNAVVHPAFVVPEVPGTPAAPLDSPAPAVNF